jgi:hypothetical protein
VLGLLPEQDLLIRCARLAFGQDVDVNPDIVSSVDWDRFVDLAAAQGLAPLTFGGCGSLGGSFSGEVRDRLRTMFAAALLRTRAGLQPNLAFIVQTLRDAAIEPVVLKGASLAYTAYPQPEYRTLSDIDLLVPRAQLSQANAVLLDAGYQPVDVTMHGGHQHLPPYISPDGLFSIELHHQLMPDDNPYALDERAFVRRAEARQLGGITAQVFGPTDTLVHVCLHLSFGHHFEWYSLRTLFDILALTTVSEAPIDWDLFVSTARASRTSGALYWLLRASRTVVGAPIPPEVLDELAPVPPVRRLFAPVLASSYILDGQAPDGMAVLYELIRHVALYSGCAPVAQAGALWACVFPPPHAVAHLPARTTESRVRYFATLTQPKRLARGTRAVLRLLARMPQTAYGG